MVPTILRHNFKLDPSFFPVQTKENPQNTTHYSSGSQHGAALSRRQAIFSFSRRWVIFCAELFCILYTPNSFLIAKRAANKRDLILTCVLTLLVASVSFSNSDLQRSCGGSFAQCSKFVVNQSK